MTNTLLSNSFRKEKTANQRKHQETISTMKARKATRRQIAALKYLIIHTDYATDLLKQILLLLIGHSDGLTKSVCVTVVHGQGHNENEIMDSAHALRLMNSPDEKTHLDKQLTLTGSKLFFNYHFGDIFCSEIKPPRFTFWLSSRKYSTSARKIRATKKSLDRVRIEDPRPHLHQS